MHFSEDILESLVLRPEDLDGDVREAVELHCGECPGCRLLVGWLRSYHEELKGIPARTSPAVDKFVDTLFSTQRLFHLTPFRPAAAVPTELTGIVVLAAMTTSNGDGAGSAWLATLASESEGLMLRVRSESGSNRLQLRLHATDRSKRDGAVVAIPGLGVEGVVDSRGCLECDIPPGKAGPSWTNQMATVLLPAVTGEAKIPPSSDPPHIFQDPGGMYTVTFGMQDDTLHLSVLHSENALPARRAVIITPDGKKTLLDLVAGRCSAGRATPGSPIRFFLYA